MSRLLKRIVKAAFRIQSGMGLINIFIFGIFLFHFLFGGVQLRWEGKRSFYERIHREGKNKNGGTAHGPEDAVGKIRHPRRIALPLPQWQTTENRYRFEHREGIGRRDFLFGRERRSPYEEAVAVIGRTKDALTPEEKRRIIEEILK